MKVESILKAKGDKVVTTRPHTPIVFVIQRMRMDSIGAMVVSSDGEHIDGMISERDIVGGLASYGPDIQDMNVAELMSTQVHTCRLGDSVKDVMATMTRSRTRHLPVVEGGKIRGILSIGDVVKNRLEEMELETNVLRDVCLATH